MPLTITPRRVATETSPNAATAAPDSLDDTPGMNTTRIWIIIAAVAALLALAACIVLVALSISNHRSKHRLITQQLEEVWTRDPYLDPKGSGRRRRMTAEELALEAESRREHLIRKSLASRSGRTESFTSSTSRLALDRASTVEKFEASGGDGTKYNWKEFEAASSLPQSMSPFPHPPAPTLPRSSSPSRHPPLPGRMELPPLLEQHPCFR
ncbi:hypothetical protein VPNG_04076 [Cytospora leucostoma]|uniref:Uncharacterized protein n=1 Tax=Cytospora leucostoma TaxID=1230097 RepID=A0A423XD50_9PEZI|nr:hypothetical protein VPNG_04076 [Cytospora leucostoma]